MGTHIDEAERLGAIADEVNRKIVEVRKRGWNVSRVNLISTEQWNAFLDKLLRSEEVVDTGKVQIFASHKFEVGDRELYVNHRAPIEKIIAFLKG